MKKLLCLLICALLLCACSCDNTGDASDTSVVPPESGDVSEVSETEQPPERTWPVINGTFIQYGPFLEYTDKQLEKHFDYLTEAGIEYLVLYTSAAYNADDRCTQAFYPSEIARKNKASAFDEKYTGFTERILTACKEHSIKAYIVPSYSEAWTTKSLINPEWAKSFASTNLEHAREIYDLYKEKYGEAFYGWYFAPEFSNYFLFWNDTLYDTASEVLNMLVTGYDEIDHDMPFLMSPYFANYEPYSNAVDTGKAWDKIFSGVNFRKGDIFCPQDCVGSGLATIKDFTDYYAEMKKAVDKYENLEFWGNPETFVQGNWTSAPITRFVRQLELAAPYVEGFISFAYPHYYAPDICGTAKYHNSYVEYARTGKVEYNSETLLPSVGGLTTSVTNTGIRISADIVNCKFGVYRVEILRDGNIAATYYVSEDEQDAPEIAFSAVDKTVKENGTYSYSLRVTEFSGESVDSETVKIDAVMPKCVSRGAKYTSDYDVAEDKYPDDGKKLTDGAFAASDGYYDAAASGYASVADVTFVIDLGQEYGISCVAARALNSGSGGAIISTGVEVSFSADGVTFTEPVSVNGISCPTEDGWAVAEFRVDENARYVRVKYAGLRNWLFIDEISVYS